MMKVAIEDKTNLVNKMLKKLEPKWQEIGQKYLDSFTKERGIRAEVEFHIDYEYLPEEDEEGLEVDFEKSKIKKVEISNARQFCETFDYYKILREIGQSYQETNKDEVYEDIYVEDLVECIDIYDVLQNAKLTTNNNLHVSCEIDNNYNFTIEDDCEFKKYGITTKLSNYIKSRLQYEIVNDIYETIGECIGIEMEANSIIRDYGPLKVLERGEEV